MVEENQSQDEVTQEVVVAETPQLTEEKPLGTEVTQKPERTYTQAEWSKRESAKDKEIDQYRSRMEQMDRQSELGGIQQAEAQAKASDQREVSEGLITPSEASQRERTRYQQVQSYLTANQQAEVFRQVAQQTEQYGRVLAAQDFGKEYELTPAQVAELLSDKNIRTPGDMKAKAADLALEKVRGESKKSKEIPPKFDQGQSGGGESYERSLKARYPSMYKK